MVSVDVKHHVYLFELTSNSGFRILTTVKTVAGELTSGKERETTPLDSLSQGQTWQRPCMRLHCEKK